VQMPYAPEHCNASHADFKHKVRTSCIRWDDDDVSFVLLVWIFIVISHWNNSSRVDMYVAPFGKNILIPSLPMFAFTPQW